MQQFLLFHFYIYHYMFRPFMRPSSGGNFFNCLLHAEPHVGCFVIPNRISLEVHKIHKIFVKFWILTNSSMRICLCCLVHTVWNPSAGSSAYQTKHKQHTQMRILELDKIHTFMNFRDFDTDFVGYDKATYMRLSA
jgi:hypothetical protein